MSVFGFQKKIKKTRTGLREMNKEWTYLKKQRSVSNHSTGTTSYNLLQAGLCGKNELKEERF